MVTPDHSLSLYTSCLIHARFYYRARNLHSDINSKWATLPKNRQETYPGYLTRIFYKSMRVLYNGTRLSRFSVLDPISVTVSSRSRLSRSRFSITAIPITRTLAVSISRMRPGCSPSSSHVGLSILMDRFVLNKSTL
ncbi:hypothetical protein BASA60_005184 [Batrachochytrium salamandrivorans]|nr:hypothetical protein BASA60_005184 [Batrachochytrium salamandrivorans]